MAIVAWLWLPKFKASNESPSDFEENKVKASCNKQKLPGGQVVGHKIQHPLLPFGIKEGKGYGIGEP